MAFIREIINLLVYNFRYTRQFAYHDYHNVFKKTLRDLKLFGFQTIKGKKVLDLGCGQRYPFALLCASEGAKVTSLDINYVKPDPLVIYFIRSLKHSGLKRATKSMLRRLCFDRGYYRTLEAYAGRHVCSSASEIKFVTDDPKHSSYSLQSGEYDLIASNAVLEHISDISGFVHEIQRLLRLGGFFYGYIHNFYSISGGHNLEWAFPDIRPSRKVPPWDHLRKNRYPTHVFLNQCKPEQFKKTFMDNLKVLLFEERNIDHDSSGKEGVRFLTDKVAEELHEYPRDLLLTRAFCIICRKDC